VQAQRVTHCLLLLSALCAVSLAQSNLLTTAQNHIFNAFAKKIPGVSWTQLAQLKSSNGDAGDLFGYSLAISGDTVVVGMDNYGRNYVYVFVKPAGGWGNMTQVAELTPSDGGDNFGTSVAIDGDTLAVGSSGNYPYGQVYVYVKPSGGWRNMTETARLTTTIEYGYTLGYDVGVSGNTVLTDSYNNSPVLVYERPKRGWKTTSMPSATLNSSSVKSFAIGGRTIVVGEGDDALVYLQPEGGWTGNVNPIAKLVPSDYFNNFAYSIAIDRQGKTVAAATETCGLCYQDALYVFTRPIRGWENMTQTAKLKIPDNFGLATVAINEDGKTIVTGSPDATVGANQFQGAVYVFARPSNGWKTTKKFSAKLTASDGTENDELGTTVGVSGNTVAAGAPDVTIGSNSYQGAAYIFGK
jgi:hypothetical protein